MNSGLNEKNIRCDASGSALHVKAWGKQQKSLIQFIQQYKHFKMRKNIYKYHSLLLSSTKHCSFQFGQWANRLEIYDNLK